MLRIFFVMFCLIEICYAENPKVLCVSVPKAGTHLLEKALQEIMQTRAKWLLSEKNIESFKQDKQELRKHTLYVMHLLSDMDLVTNATSFRRILLIRDPRDVMVSFYYHLTSKKAWPFKLQFARADFYNHSFEERMDEMLFYTQNTPVEGIISAAQWMQDPDVLVIRFEDLVGAKGGGSDEVQFETLLKLASFVGYPKTFQEMKEIANRLFGGTFTFRNGQIGEWKTFFLPHHTEKLKSLIGQEVIQLGYASDLNW